MKAVRSDNCIMPLYILRCRHAHLFNSGEQKPTNPLEAFRVGSHFPLGDQESLLVKVQNTGQEKACIRKKVGSNFLLEIQTA